MKQFEEAFMMEMENKHADLLAEFKKGNLPEEGIAKMTALAESLIAQFKK